jgi:hypothetical protein
MFVSRHVYLVMTVPLLAPLVVLQLQVGYRRLQSVDLNVAVTKLLSSSQKYGAANPIKLFKAVIDEFP